MKNKTTNPRFEFRVFGDDLQTLVAMFHMNTMKNTNDIEEIKLLKLHPTIHLK